jgi:hypothetical protein
VAPFAVVAVPPGRFLSKLYAWISNVPELIVRSPVITISPVMVAVPEGLLIVKLLKVVALMACGPVPSKISFPPVETKVPLLFQFPWT